MSATLVLFPELFVPPSPRLRRRLSAPPEGALGASSWSRFTPRQREVFAMPRTYATLMELRRDKPRKACTICWRDMQHALAGAEDQVACSRIDGTSGTRWCQLFVVQCLRDAQRRREAAKVSLLAELEGGAA